MDTGVYLKIPQGDEYNEGEIVGHSFKIIRDSDSELVARKLHTIPNLGAFSVIGFDQVLHYIQLIITWKLIFNI